jgi:hypothetical protein
MSSLRGYIDFTDPVVFKEKQKVPHSYSRAVENARFANGVRDDETKKDYIDPEIALATPSQAASGSSFFGL